MALLHLSSPLVFSSARLPPKYAPQAARTDMGMAKHVRCCLAGTQTIEPTVARRSANYQPSCWDYDFVMSLSSDYTGETYRKRAEELKETVRHLVNESKEPVAQIELIDVIQRLGVGRHFECEIKRALDIEYINNNDQRLDDDLHTTALRFRLLRQHGYDVPQDVFNSFKDGMGNFKKCISEDVKGMLSLYEACHYALEGENVMDQAKAFTCRHLEDLKGTTSPTFAKKIAHSMEVPLHWMLPRLEARWYIDTYESEEDMNPILLELAKLDYNMVQATHQREVGKLARWWVDLGLHKLSFTRDRLVEHFFWSVGMVSEPQFGYFRDGLTKVTTLITIVDDIYDVYGSLEELELFTNAVERWDVNAMKALPQYMKMCFLALYNTNNQIGYEILKEQGFDITSYQKKAWVDLCKAYLVEAKWYYKGYTPTLEEYLDNAVISIAAPLMLFNAYFLTTKKITREALECIENYPSLISCSSMLLRLADDLGTSTDELKRGDVPKSIQCYMREKDISEEAARDHIRHLISDTWKKMNKDRVAHYPFSGPLISAAVNLGRTAQCMYQYSDGHGVPDRETKDRLMSLLVEPVPFK